MSASAIRRTTAKSICIIGAGPSGLAAAKYLLAEKCFDKIEIIEQRKNVGGLWNYTALHDDTCAPPGFHIPQTDPFYGQSGPDKRALDSDSRPTFTTPIYDKLETNIPLGLLGFSDQDWPADHPTPLFPRHTEVLRYLERYGEDVKHLIQFETQVTDVHLDSQQRWNVTTQQLHQDASHQKHESFDAVIVASGHYAVPFIPDVNGLKEWNLKHPGRISHSKFFRRAESYAGQKVLVIGNAASGSDIGRQIAEHSAQPLLYSTRSESYLFANDPERYNIRPEITAYDSASRGVTFKDGTKAENIDRVLYCTGYMYSYPFLQSLQSSNAPLIGTGERVQNLYQHIFYRPHPTLVFLGLPQKVIPFPFAEAQSAVVAKVLAGRLTLPDDTEMAHWEAELLLEKNGNQRVFHVLKFPEDADHINMLHDWAQSAGTDGKEPPYWLEKQYWIRENFPAIRQAYLGFGEDRFGKHTLEDVGFDFAAWKAKRSQSTQT